MAGYPLIAYSIAAARSCSQIDRVIVSTDSEHIAELSRRYDAEVPFIRPTALAGDSSTDREFVIHALEWFKENEGTVPNLLVHLRPTTPLRDPRLIGQAIAAFASNSQATSLRSAHEAPESPLKWFVRDEDGYFHGFNPGDPRPGYSNLPRQSFPPVYVPDGYVDILRTSFVLGADDIHGPRIMAFVSPVCREVDTLDDIEFLEFQLGKAGTALSEFLSSHYPPEV